MPQPTHYQVPVPRMNPMSQPVGATGAWSVGQQGMSRMPASQGQQQRMTPGQFATRTRQARAAGSPLSPEQLMSMSGGDINQYNTYYRQSRMARTPALSPDDYFAMTSRRSRPQPGGGMPGGLAASAYFSGVSPGGQNVGTHAQEQVSNVQNPAAMMMGGMPTMMSGGDVMSALGLGNDWRKLAGQRNLAAFNTWRTTEPVEAQMQRHQLAANVGVDQMGLVNQGEQNIDQYNNLLQQRRLAAMQAIYR